MKLLLLRQTANNVGECNKKDGFMTTYFYQQWESFSQNQRHELRKVKKTEHLCNELKVQLIHIYLYIKFSTYLFF